MFLKILDRLEEVLIGTLLAGATLVIFVAVVHRYLAGVPIPHLQDWLVSLNLSWAQEACIFMGIWMAKFGAAYGVRQGIHVGVDVLVRKLSPARRKPLTLIALLLGALFTSVIGTVGAQFVWEIAHTDQTTPDMELPTWIAYLCIPFGSFLMCFRFLQVAWTYLRTGELPHHDHGHVEGVEEDVTPVVTAGGRA